MVIRVGMIGYSEGNGHPLSFSSIINGYSEEELKKSGWPVIYDYISRRNTADFGVGELMVTHAWTQSLSFTKTLCRAANIPHCMTQPEDMLGDIDALIIARDDAENHYSLAYPFLENKIPVYIDKPLTLDRKTLDYFLPYLHKGLLMSCSSMRYAVELDDIRVNLAKYGNIKLIRGTILNDWTRYGVHMLEAIMAILPSRPVSVHYLPASHDCLMVLMDDGTSVMIDALGKSPPIYDLEVLGCNLNSRHSIQDNFTMFRRSLWSFSTMIRESRPIIPPQSTLDIILTLIAGLQAQKMKRDVLISSLY